jgi:hypothetical protein
MGATNVWTYTIGGSSINISNTENVQRVSVICSGGTIEIKGSSTFQNIPSVPVTLAVGQGLTIATKNDSTPIDGLLIDATLGVADIVLTFQ